MTDEEFAKFLGHLAEAEAALNNPHLLIREHRLRGGLDGLRASCSAIAVVRDIEVSWHKLHPESENVPGGIKPATHRRSRSVHTGL